MRDVWNKTLGGRSSGSSAKTKSRVLVTRVQYLFSDQLLSLQRRLYTSGTSDTGRLQALSVQSELQTISDNKGGSVMITALALSQQPP